MKILFGLLSFMTSLYLFFDIGSMDYDGIPTPLIIAGFIASALFFVISIVLMVQATTDDQPTPDTKSIPTPTPTPQQLYRKCCYCEHYVNCNKFTVGEIQNCKEKGVKHK
jgi:hypothetical protein